MLFNSLYAAFLALSFTTQRRSYPGQSICSQIYVNRPWLNVINSVVICAGISFSLTLTSALVDSVQPTGAIRDAWVRVLPNSPHCDTILSLVAKLLSACVGISLLGLTILPHCLEEPHEACVLGFALAAGGLIVLLCVFYDIPKHFALVYAEALFMCWLFYNPEPRGSIPFFMVGEVLGTLGYINFLGGSVRSKLTWSGFNALQWLAVGVPAACFVTYLQNLSVQLCIKHYLCFQDTL